MQMVYRGALALALAALASPASAEISESGAKTLADDLAVYVGRAALVDGILTVAPVGDAYQVTIDLQKAAEGVKPPAGEADLTVGPLTFKAVPADNGTWAVAFDSFPAISVRQKRPEGKSTLDVKVNGYKFDGIYDPKLAAFTSGTLKSSGMSFASNSPEGDVVAEYGETTGTMSAVGSGADAVDATFAQTSASLTETMVIKGATPMTIKIVTGKVSLDAAVKAGRGRSLLQIVSFFAQNPQMAKIVAGQDDLRSRLTAALPLWESTAGTIAAKDVAVETPLGSFKAAELGELVTMSGLQKDGSYGIRFSMKGFEAPPGILPAWTTSVVPKDFDVAASVSGFDLAAASKLVIDAFDLSKPEPLSKEDQDKLTALFSSGSFKVTLPPGSLTSSSLTLSFEGEATVIPQLVAKATVTADGLDKTLADLQGGSDADPNRQQALMMLGLAKNLAKPGDGGKSIWTIEAAKDGSISVNGQQMQGPTQP